MALSAPVEEQKLGKRGVGRNARFRTWGNTPHLTINEGTKPAPNK